MNQIGFCNRNGIHPAPIPPVGAPRSAVPRKSVVQVRFPGYGIPLTYYNDSFDLRNGDLVNVEGKMSGIRGRVVDISYNFKIKLSEYKRIIALIDTDIHGTFFFAGSHFITFDPAVLPPEKIRAWFLTDTEDEEYASGNDGTAFPLDDLNGMKIAPQIAERGHDYYMNNHIKYLSINGTRGYSIVEGAKPYEVEFEYCNGIIKNLTCSCFCSYNCKHTFAAMLQLKETLELIEKHYGDKYSASGCFAAVSKDTLFCVAIDGKETGSLTL